MKIWKKLLNLLGNEQTINVNDNHGAFYVEDQPFGVGEKPYVEEDPEKKISIYVEPDPTEKPVETKVKVRVKPFDNECTMYIIEYYIDGIGWERFETNIFFDTISLCSYNHPVLISNFDEAVKKAKSLTLEYSTKYNSERKIEFRSKNEKII